MDALDRDRVILSKGHLELRDRLKRGPAFGFELAEEFGDEYLDMLSVLRYNDHPVHSTESCSSRDPERMVHYFEKPGTELIMCTWCGRRRRTRGLFCSNDCQLDWELERLAELGAEVDVEDMGRTADEGQEASSSPVNSGDTVEIPAVLPDPDHAQRAVYPEPDFKLTRQPAPNVPRPVWYRAYRTKSGGGIRLKMHLTNSP